MADCPWDLNGDGVVDDADSQWLQDHWGACVPGSKGDFNGDGTIDLSDMMILQSHYGPCPNGEMETKTTSLTEGNHNVQIQLTGYETFTAVINVSSTAVSCVSVAGGGACGGSGLPRLEASGWTVTAYLKTGTSGATYAEWLTDKGGLDNITLPDIFELKDAFIGLTTIGFTPTLPQIMDCKDAFIGL